MLLCMYNFVPFRMYRERERRILNDAQYRVNTSHVMVSIPCDLIDRLFQECNNLTITLRPSPRQSPAPFYISALDPGDPGLMVMNYTLQINLLQPTRMDGRIESHIVDSEMLPSENGAVTAEPSERLSPRFIDNIWEVKRRQRTNQDISRYPYNNFTSNSSDNRNSSKVNNGPRGRDLF